jgi:hypothetical protein
METKPIRSKVGNDQSIHAAMLQARTIRQLARAATISHVGCRHAQLTLRPGRNNSRCNPRDKPAGKRWRFGENFWTTLDTNMELTIGGVKVP